MLIVVWELTTLDITILLTTAKTITLANKILESYMMG
jgi:hypothetical protein